MDKSWIAKPRNTPEYMKGLLNFLDFAFANASSDNRIKCPCSHCGFRIWQTREEVYDHLICKPFPQGYTVWLLHGEKDRGEASSSIPVTQHSLPFEDPMQDMIHDAFDFSRYHVDEESPTSSGPINDGEGRSLHLSNGPSDEAKQFYDLLRDGEQELYEGCSKYSKLSFLVKLYHIKCICGMSDKAMSMIVELLHDAFEHAKIPESFYEAKKTINKLGLNYTKIHACPNDCMLYRGLDKTRQTCKQCGTSRWKSKTKGNSSNVSEGAKKKKPQPAKVLRYFPLIPRLQRLYMSCKTSSDMRWHAINSNEDGFMRHPRDSEAWKKFDSTFPEFSSDARNVRLALASDGFNPFGNMSTNYSIWPVVLIPYNTPPWKCMKQTSFILSMIIPGKRMPGNDIDVYLQPLIDELKQLWDGVETFDVSSNETFNMRAALMWTISDFPGYGTLSGWNTYGKLVCPICNIDAEPCRLHHSKKWCFMGHRRFLNTGHKFRLDKVRFNGKVDKRNPPLQLSGSDILKQVENIQVSFGKMPEVEVRGKRGRGQQNAKGESHYWRKKSIFFELPYWEFNILRHNLDVMHIEKNVCDNVIYTLLNESGKSKDHLNARKDLQSMGIRKDLWPYENGKYPHAIFTMSNAQKDIFLQTLKNVIVPDGYSSNISRCVDLKQRKLSGLKSHDCHILMEQLLPISLRNAMPGLVSAVLIDLCSFFRQLCGKVLDPIDLDSLQDQVVLTLCHLEMIFPPSFFTVMVHLVVHLVNEAKHGGPVHYRWMYPIERYLGHLKSFVRNKAQPEGSIAEGYMSDEILTFCSRYLDDIETRINRPRRVDDQPNDVESHERATLFPKVGRPVGGYSYFNLTPMEKLQAHRHVLVNCEAVEPFLQEFRIDTRRRLRSRTRSQSEIDKVVHKEFTGWFHKRIMNDVNGQHSDEIRFLARGPLEQAKRFSAYNVNGFKFRTLARDHGLKTQNSGVFGTFDTRSYASNRDNNTRVGGVPYYGKLVDIIELNYYGQFMVTLFKCQWANTTTDRGMTKDELGFTSVNFSRLIHVGDRENDEPYIKASEAQLVYYVDDEVNKEWSVVVHLKPRDLYDMGAYKDEDPIYDSVPIQQQDLDRWLPFQDGNGDLQLTRNDIDDEPPINSNVDNIDEEEDFV